MAGFFISLLFHRKLANHRVPLFLTTIFWCIPVVIIQRVVPYPYIWLFALPLYLMISSAGINFISSEFFKNNVFGKTYQLFFVSFCLIVLFCLNLVILQRHTKTIYYPEDPGVLIDAEQATLFLKNHMGESNKILAVCPTNFAVQYYSMRHGLPFKHFRDLKDGDSVYVVVKEKEQILEGVLASSGLSYANFNAPRMVRAYDSAKIYVMEKSVKPR
jgi:hypothetical protein